MHRERDYYKYQEMLEEEEYERRHYEERKFREENEYYWNCPFFRHCWNEGLKLPTFNNCLNAMINIGSIAKQESTADLYMNNYVLKG